MNGNKTDSDGRPVVRGDRTCLRCKGICHENSVRKVVPDGFDFRRHYFCSKTCLKMYYELKFYQDSYEIFERHGNLEEFEREMERVADELLGGEYPRYEFVDVITK